MVSVISLEKTRFVFLFSLFGWNESSGLNLIGGNRLVLFDPGKIGALFLCFC